MADVRALLKAKRQEARITHPYAAYNASGQLKCSVCDSIVKHASAWEGHLGSKLHRTNIARLREEEKRQLQREREPQGRAETTGKRKAIDNQTEVQDEKRRRVEATNQAQGSQYFPQDFFSDPSHAPVLLSQESDDEEEEEENTASQQQRPAPVKQSDVDAEYERFQRELLSSNTDPSEAYDRATVAAEPILASTEIPGFPSTFVEEVPPEPVQLSMEEVRLKREQDERELIMDRLLAEERAQEDADTRVQLLQTKLESLRNKRQATKANKKNPTH